MMRIRELVKYPSIVGILLLLSLISIEYFIDFNGNRIYCEETSMPDTDSVVVYMPDSSSTGTMPDTEEEPDADVKGEADIEAKGVSEHISGGGSGGGFFHITNSEPSPVDPKIKDHDEDYKDGITATWTMSNMMPGDFVSRCVKFINNGDTAASNLMVTCTSVKIDPPAGPESDTEEGTTDLDKEMIIAEMIYYHGYQGTEQIGCLSLLNDNNDNDNIDLDDLEAQTIELPAPGKGDYATTLNMTIQFNPDAGNNYQGDILNSTFVFTLIE